MLCPRRRVRSASSSLLVSWPSMNNLPVGRTVEQTDDVEQRALARARRADERHELAARQHEVDIVQDLDLDGRADIVGLADASQAQDFVRLSHGSPPPDRAWPHAAPAPRPPATPVTAASSTAPTNNDGSRISGNSSLPSGWRMIGVPEDDAPRRPGGADERPDKAEQPPCSRKTRRICPCDVPMARRMPMSFDRWMTDTTSTLAMPNATDRPTKRRISVLAMSLRAHRGEELRVGLDPAVGLDPVSPPGSPARSSSAA